MRFPELTEKQKLELSRIKVAGTDVGYYSKPTKRRFGL